MAKHTRQCFCCGNSYDYCPGCRQYLSQPKWKALYDTEKCKEIFNVLSGYFMKLKTIEDVKKVVDDYNITDFSEFKPNIEKQLIEILKEDKSVEKIETTANALTIDKDIKTDGNDIKVANDNKKSNKRKRNKYNMDIELNNDI